MLREDYADSSAPVLLTDADADRLMLLSRPVNSRPAGEHLVELEAKVANADVCDPEEMPPDIVTMNSRVRVRFLDTAEDWQGTLVFPSGANVRHNRISVLGAFGRALLGARIGDVLSFDSGAGPRRCRIEELIYQPEAAGEHA